MKLRRVALVFAMTVFAVPAFTQSTVPSSFNFQSKLYAPSGSPYTTPQGQTTDVTFKLYTSESGTSEIYKKKINIVINGGIVESAIDDQPGYPPINDLVKQNGTIYLGVQVGTDAELKPRMKLNSTPFAGHANYSSTAGVAEDVPLKNINPASITINGQQVLDSVGNVNGTTLGVSGTTLFNAAGQWVGPAEIGEMNGWTVNGVNVTTNKTVKATQTVDMQHCAVRQVSGQPAIHFHNDSGNTSVVWDARLVLSNDDQLTLKGANFHIEDDTNSAIWMNVHPASISMVGNPTSNIFFRYNESPTPTMHLSAGDKWLHIVRSSGPTTQFEANGALGLNRFPGTYLLEVEGEAFKVSGSGSWVTPSDRRIKQNVETITNAVETLAKVRLVEFDHTPEYSAAHPSIANRRHMNVIAQEFRDVFPDYVREGTERLPTGEPILQVDPYPLTIYSAAAVQELARENADLRSEIDEMRRQIDELRAAVSALSRR